MCPFFQTYAVVPIMERATKPQIASVEQELLEDELPIVHCPICGQGVISLLESGETEENYCTHIEFSFCAELAEFDYTAERFLDRWKSCIEARPYEEPISETISVPHPFGKFDTMNEMLEAMGYDNRLLVLDVGSYGLSCGPCEMSVMYGFNYGALSPKGK